MENLEKWLDTEIKELKDHATSNNMFIQGKLSEAIRIRAIMKDMSDMGWISVEKRLPDTDDYIMLSFENYTLPTIGRYKVDAEGNGAFYDGDDDRTCVSYGLFVNAWMPLIKPYREDDDD